jgi:hypothetical protein
LSTIRLSRFGKRTFNKKQTRLSGMSEKTEKKLIKTQKDIEKLIILMKKHKVDCLEIEGKRIVISKHDYGAPANQEKNEDVDSELEFWNLRPQ